MAPEEQPKKEIIVTVSKDHLQKNVTHKNSTVVLLCTVSKNLSSTKTVCCQSYFLLTSVSVTPFKDTFKFTMVGMKEPEAFSSVEDTAFCTAQGPVSVSVGTAFRQTKLQATVEKKNIVIV